MKQRKKNRIEKKRKEKKRKDKIRKEQIRIRKIRLDKKDRKEKTWCDGRGLKKESRKRMNR